MNITQKSLVRYIGFEIWLSWRFVRNDIWTTVIPLTLFSFGLSYQLNNSDFAMLKIIILACIYFYLFDYVFEINSQIFGVEEDRLNKPDRPIPSGIIRLDQAKRRAVVITSLFIMVAAFLGNLVWAGLWFLLVYFYSYTTWSTHWFLKSVFVSLGTLTQFPAAATIAGYPVNELFGWMIAIFIMMTLTIHVQEFRDVEGDKAVGRKTMPVVFGVAKSRIIISVTCLLCVLISHFTLYYERIPNPFNQAFEIAAALLLMSISLRMWNFSPSREHDHFSFRLLEYWYTLTCLSIITYQF